MDAPARQGSAPEIIAHRGFSAVAPENTLAAIEAAISAGANAVEFDVHVSRDGHPVLIHDATLDRTTNGVGAVRLRTVAELRSLDAGSWFSADFTGEPIPTLAEALERLRDRVSRVYVEVKGFRDPAELDAMVELLDEATLRASAVFIAIDWTVLDHLRRSWADLAIGYIVDRPDRSGAALERVTGDRHAILDFDARILTAAPVWASRAREAGTELVVWTVDDVDTAERLADLGVTRFTTNQVNALMDWSRRR